MRPLLQKIGVNLRQLGSQMEGELHQEPQGHGERSRVGVVLGGTGRIFDTAQSLADQMKDAFVSTEHLLLALTQVDDQPKRLLQINGVAERFVGRIEVHPRRAAGAGSKSGREVWCQKYGHDLVAFAHAGKN